MSILFAEDCIAGAEDDGSGECKMCRINSFKRHSGPQPCSNCKEGHGTAGKEGAKMCTSMNK